MENPETQFLAFFVVIMLVYDPGSPNLDSHFTEIQCYRILFVLFWKSCGV